MCVWSGDFDGNSNEKCTTQPKHTPPHPHDMCHFHHFSDDYLIPPLTIPRERYLNLNKGYWNIIMQPKIIFKSYRLLSN